MIVGTVMRVRRVLSGNDDRGTYQLVGRIENLPPDSHPGPSTVTVPPNETVRILGEDEMPESE